VKPSPIVVLRVSSFFVSFSVPLRGSERGVSFVVKSFAVVVLSVFAALRETFLFLREQQ